MQRNGNRKQTRAVQIAALAAAALVAGIGLSRHHAEARQQSYETFELATTIGDGFTIASVGDLIMAFPASKLSDPARQAAFDLVRGADVGFANMESTILDAATWDGDFAGPFVGTPDVAEDVKNLGFDLVARSNNHSGEYGIEGLLDTNERLARAGVVSAGSGESYWAARAPRFASTRPISDMTSGWRTGVCRDSPRRRLRGACWTGCGSCPSRSERPSTSRTG